MSAGGTSLALQRRLRDPQFRERIFVGRAIDIGAGPDSLAGHTWPKLLSVRDWDIQHGDAVHMAGVDEQFDVVYSSHCLEHLTDPVAALRRWWEIVRPGGHLVLVVPDEDLYEQRRWPSAANSDHKATFTLHKVRSWSPASINVLPTLMELPHARIVRAEWLEDGFDYSRTDGIAQTALGTAECAIECVVRKDPTSHPESE